MRAHPRVLPALAIALLAGSLLAGCVASPASVEELARPEQQRVLHGELVREMLAQDRNHAALAHLQELERQRGRLDDDQRLLRAEAFYRLREYGSAEKDYQVLTRSSLAGQAWHGLGRLHTPSDLRAALQAFNEAVAARPTDPAVRNDLGYALLLAGRVEDACRQLYTAHELAPQQQRVVGNLLLCEALRNDLAARERLFQVHGFTSAERERHQRDVVQLQWEIQRRRHELLPPPSENPS
ncbi:MAG: tetratricopeptide repeat protein [Oceanococcaceae bacterium]